MKKSKKTLITVIVSIIIIVSILPHNQPCGAPGRTCATAPNENGVYSVSYDVQPNIISALEYIFRTNINIYYKRYEHSISIR